MFKKKQMLIVSSIVVTSFLLGSMFNMNSIASGGSSSPWDKVWTAVSELQTRVDGINDTLTSRIENLEAQIADLQTDTATLQSQITEMNACLKFVEGYVETMLTGYVNPPAYDSGWVKIDAGQVITLTHNLGTTNLFVYMIGRAGGVGHSIHQSYYGGGRNGDNALGCILKGGTTTTISVERRLGDGSYNPRWEYVRVMIWRILEPPT